MRQMKYVFLFVAFFAGCTVAEESQFRKVVPFGDSWFLEKMVGGGHRQGWPFVLAEKLGVPCEKPIAEFGLTSDDLYPLVNQHINEHRNDSLFYGPNDLPVIHVGGNDIQPAILEVWLRPYGESEQRSVIRSYLKPLVESTAKMVDNMCGKPFQVVMVSQPPFSRFLPIIARAVWSSNLKQLREETTQMYKNEFQSNKYQGCKVVLFEEGFFLDDLGNQGLQSYVDLLHPDANIHRRLGEIAFHLLRDPESFEMMEAKSLFTATEELLWQYKGKSIKCCVSSASMPSALQDLNVKELPAARYFGAKTGCGYMFGDTYHNGLKPQPLKIPHATCPVPASVLMEITGESYRGVKSLLKNTYQSYEAYEL